MTTRRRSNLKYHYNGKCQRPSHCVNCQMLTFLCVNEYSSDLPHVDTDACRIIFEQLKLLYSIEYDKLADERQRSIKVMNQFMYGSSKHRFNQMLSLP